jgi:hypothetical protein
MIHIIIIILLLIISGKPLASGKASGTTPGDDEMDAAFLNHGDIAILNS